MVKEHEYLSPLACETLRRMLPQIDEMSVFSFTDSENTLFTVTVSIDEDTPNRIHLCRSAEPTYYQPKTMARLETILEGIHGNNAFRLVDYWDGTDSIEGEAANRSIFHTFSGKLEKPGGRSFSTIGKHGQLKPEHDVAIEYLEELFQKIRDIPDILEGCSREK